MLVKGGAYRVFVPTCRHTTSLEIPTYEAKLDRTGKNKLEE
jgi:hypothetical protein